MLVFPVWWWSLPALLKGLVDRVLITGWPFDLDAEECVVPRLQRVTAHLIPVSGTTEASFVRHGYGQAFSTQVEHGILDYCGLTRGVTAFVRDSESGDEEAVGRQVEAAVDRVVAAVSGGTEGAADPSGPRV
ncbi:NAD(P)H-dependent oxidoreductase [Auraticoccus monumenti]|uniref:NAD(P)H-dependent oxidoreductase n=1 Tax=Auraticoccus monumenti TaxID=675864 RepID=UPI0018D4CA3E|nr:NAD(P)H-dependent oxidoreductase [Auraticoccus monumenti]